MKFGLWAEKWIIEILKRNGSEAEEATRVEDKVFKVDFWVRKNEYWIPVQFSIDKKAIIGWKGLDALQRGIVPMWIKDRELEMAFLSGNGIGVVKEFWTRIEKLLIAYPTVKRFPEPRWNSHSTINN